MLRRYAHVGTGNYHAMNARSYEDFGLFTADPDIAADVADLFNYLTGFGRPQRFRKLLVAPWTLRSRLIDEIRASPNRRSRKGPDPDQGERARGPGDHRGLYDASQAGAEIELVVRNIALRSRRAGAQRQHSRPQRARPVLEHSRVFIFEAGKATTHLLGSADRRATSTTESRFSLLSRTAGPSSGSTPRSTRCSPTTPRPGSSAPTGAGSAFGPRRASARSPRTTCSCAAPVHASDDPRRGAHVDLRTDFHNGAACEQRSLTSARTRFGCSSQSRPWSEDDLREGPSRSCVRHRARVDLGSSSARHGRLHPVMRSWRASIVRAESRSSSRRRDGRARMPTHSSMRWRRAQQLHVGCSAPRRRAASRTRARSELDLADRERCRLRRRRRVNSAAGRNGGRAGVDAPPRPRVLRLTARCLHSNPPTKGELELARNEVAERFAPVTPPLVRTLLATGGSARPSGASRVASSDRRSFAAASSSPCRRRRRNWRPCMGSSRPERGRSPRERSSCPRHRSVSASRSRSPARVREGAILSLLSRAEAAA